MFNKFIKTIILCLSLANSTHSQAPYIEWQKCYGGPGSEGGIFIQPTNDGGSIACGQLQAQVIGGDITSVSDDGTWLIKLDATGTLLWQKNLPGSAGYQVRQATDGGYVVLGDSINDYRIIKLNSTGNIEWQKAYGGSSSDVPSSIEQTADGGYIVSGNTLSSDGDITGYHGSTDGWVLKLDEQGDLVWQRTLGGTALDVTSDAKQTADGGYIVSGMTSSFDGDVVNPSHAVALSWIIKLDADGNIVWQKIHGNGEARSICLTNDGGYAFTANCFNAANGVLGNHGLEDYWIVKLDASGNMVWQATMGGSNSDQPRCIIQAADGGFVVSGRSQSTNGDMVGNHGGFDYWIVKVSSTGVPEWTKALGGTGFDFGYGIYQTADQGYIVIGGTSSNNDGDVGPNHGNSDIWVVKLAPEVLPLTLISFNATLKTNDVLCNWITGQEQNTSHFIIERSDDAVHYVTAGRVEASHNSSLPVAYNFTDKNVLLSNSNYLYYRLKMVDIDGKFSYSRVVKILINKNSAGIVLMGNPVNGSLLINVTDKSIINTAATIINNLGAIVKTVLLKEGLQNIDVSKSPAGNYFIKTNAGSQKFIISR